MFKNQNGGSKAEITVKLALIFFLALFSFSVGTFVGKQFSDSDKKAAALQDDYKPRGVASEDEHGNPSHDAVTNDEVDQLADEFLAAEDKNMEGHEPTHKEEGSHEESHPQESDDSAANTQHDNGYKKMGHSEEKKSHQSASQHEEPKQKTATHDNGHKKENPHTKGEPSKAAKRVSKGMTPTPPHKEKREPSSVLPKLGSSTIGKYTVQVSSYSTEREAKEHAANLKNHGYSSFYVPAQVKGKTWFRVSIGLFDNYQSANHFKKELEKESLVTSSIVQKIVQ